MIFSTHNLPSHSSPLKNTCQSGLLLGQRLLHLHFAAFSLCSHHDSACHQLPMHVHLVTAAAATATSYCMYNLNLTRFIKQAQICVEMLILTDATEETEMINLVPVMSLKWATQEYEYRSWIYLRKDNITCLWMFTVIHFSPFCYLMSLIFFRSSVGKFSCHSFILLF